MIRFDQVSYSFPSGHEALSGVSLYVGPGEIVALMGANGSGKSTVLRLACGLIEPSAGQILRGAPAAYVAQDPHANIVGETVEEDVSFVLNLRHESPGIIDQRVHEALKLVGMEWARQRSMSSLSGGEIQRVALASAIAGDARVLILDEPTGHLPRSEARAFWQSLLSLTRTLGTTLLYATHQPQEARLAHRIYGLVHGRIALVGTPSGLLGRADLLTAVGLRFDVSIALEQQLCRREEDFPKPANRDAKNDAGGGDRDERIAKAICSALNL